MFSGLLRKTDTWYSIMLSFYINKTDVRRQGALLGLDRHTPNENQEQSNLFKFVIIPDLRTPPRRC